MSIKTFNDLIDLINRKRHWQKSIRPAVYGVLEDYESSDCSLISITTYVDPKVGIIAWGWDGLSAPGASNSVKITPEQAEDLRRQLASALEPSFKTSTLETSENIYYQTRVTHASRFITVETTADVKSSSFIEIRIDVSKLPLELIKPALLKLPVIEETHDAAVEAAATLLKEITR